MFLETSRCAQFNYMNYFPFSYNLWAYLIYMQKTFQHSRNRDVITSRGILVANDVNLITRDILVPLKPLDHHSTKVPKCDM